MKIGKNVNQKQHIMKPIKHLAIAAFLLATPAIAQQAAPEINDAKAKSILDEVSKNAKTFKTVKASFVLTITNADGSKQTQEGDITLKGEKFKVRMKQKGKDKAGKEKEFVEEYISDTKTSWNYSEKNNEVTIDNAKTTTKEGWKMSDLFVLHEKGFRYKFDKEEVQSGVAVQVINLYPTKPDQKKYHTVRVVIDKAKKQIISATFLNKDGSKTTYVVKNMTPNTEVPDTTFSFDVKAHPKVVVVNLKEDED